MHYAQQPQQNAKKTSKNQSKLPKALRIDQNKMEKLAHIAQNASNSIAVEDNHEVRKRLSNDRNAPQQTVRIRGRSTLEAEHP